MGWKAFAAFRGLALFVSILIIAWSQFANNLVALIGLPINTGATIGLFCYSHQATQIDQRVWRVFSIVLAGWYAFTPINFLLFQLKELPLDTLKVEHGTMVIGVILGVAMVLALNFFTWLAVYRYAQIADGERNSVS